MTDVASVSDPLVELVTATLDQLWADGYIYAGDKRDEWSRGFDEAAQAFVAALPAGVADSFRAALASRSETD